ncbi:hypothetical protein [Streptomyces sp. NPDC005141]
MLFPTPDLTETDRQVLDQIDQMRETLRHSVRTSSTKRTAGLRKFLTADAVAASNSIEGFKVATVDVEDLMEGESEVDISEENREETLAYQRMMTYIQTLHDAEDFSYSKGLLRTVRASCRGGQRPVRVSRSLRPGAPSLGPAVWSAQCQYVDHPSCPCLSHREHADQPLAVEPGVRRAAEAGHP